MYKPFLTILSDESISPDSHKKDFKKDIVLEYNTKYNIYYEVVPELIGIINDSEVTIKNAKVIEKAVKL